MSTVTSVVLHRGGVVRLHVPMVSREVALIAAV